MAKTSAPPDRRNTNGQFARIPTDKGTLVEELTARQADGTRFANAASVGAAFLWANGGSQENPMAFPGYDQLYGISLSNYRWMLQHPILRLVRFVSIAPVLANTWNYEKTRKNVPDEWGQKIAETFNVARLPYLRTAIRAMDYGYSVGEPIWEYRDGMYWFSRLKELARENTRVLRDSKGNFVGLRQYRNQLWNDDLIDANDKTRRLLGLPSRKDEATARDGTDPYVIDLPAPFKAWHWAYDSENNDPRGRSWLENCRQTAWKDWLDTMQQMQKTGTKISGMISIVTSPAGTFPGPNNTSVSYEENAKTIIKALADGAAGVWFPSLGLSPDSRGNVDAMKVLAEIAGKSLSSIEVKDFGNHASAIGGFLDRLRHAEELMFAARGRSPRVAMEGKSGIKADAMVHTDTSITVCELEDQELAESVQPLIDADLVLNYGERARGAYRVRPPSIAQRKTDLFRTLLLAGLNDPAVISELFTTMNVDLMLKALDIDVKKPFSADDMKKFAENKVKEAAAVSGEKSDGKKPKNGKGLPNDQKNKEDKAKGPSGTGLRKGKEK